MADTAGVTDAEILAWSCDTSPRLRIAARLAREVMDGKYGNWKLLPSASALADEYDVSPRTVDRAKHLLADRGLMRREGRYYYAMAGANE